MVTGIYYIWTSYSYSNSIYDRKLMKKLFGFITIIATAILSGVALSKFLNWAGKQEDFFDFDLDEDIDNEQF